MSSPVPEAFRDLLSRETKAFAALALVTGKGEPQVTPMWFDFDGEDIIFNTARGRLKDRVMKKLPAVALAIQDPANPYRYLQIRGRVISETEEGAYESICSLREKYRGDRNYPRNPGEVRVIYKVHPESATTMG